MAAAGKMAALALLPLLMALFLVQLALCASVMDRFLEGDAVAVAVLGSTLFLLMVLLTLIAHSVGVATLIMGLIHGASRDDDTGGAKHANTGSNLTTLGLLALAFGFTCKAINERVPSGTSASIRHQIRAIEAFNIINLFFLLLYLFMIGMFTRSSTRHTDASSRVRKPATAGAPAVAGAAGTGGAAVGAGSGGGGAARAAGDPKFVGGHEAA